MIKTCGLCLEKEADKTGSHIFSFFLIRDVVNKIGIKRRENEIAFALSPDSFVNSYIGSEILPEDIEKVKGKKLQEEDIEVLENAPNPFTRDHIICTECERKLGVLESYVNTRVFGKLRKHEVKEGTKVETVEFPECEALRLFVYSLCWRAAEVDYSGFRMDKSHKEQLRRWLHQTLDLELSGLQHKLKANSAYLTSLPLLAVFLETKGINTNFIYPSWCEKPYWMIINDFSFQLFFNEKAPKHNEEYVFGINALIKKMKTLNHKEEKIIISVIHDEGRKKVNEKVQHFIADKMLRSATSIFKSAFKQFYRKEAPSGIIKYYMFLISTHQSGGIENFTPEHFSHAARNAIAEHSARTGEPMYIRDESGILHAVFANRVYYKQ